MTTGDLHEIAPNLVVIEGHHPHAMWEDPDLPTIAAYRGERTLYLFDTGVGPEQRAALLRVAEQLGGAEEVLLLNSHGHVDHLGNNDVLAEIPAARRRHLFPRAARPALDFEAFFGRHVPPRCALLRLPDRAHRSTRPPSPRSCARSAPTPG